MVLQDKKASSSMDEVLDLAEVNGLVRQALVLLKGCEISLEDASFHLSVTSALTWFKVSQLNACKHSWTLQTTSHSSRVHDH